MLLGFFPDCGFDVEDQACYDQTAQTLPDIAMECADIDFSFLEAGFVS